ncbi:hypothetical protein [Tepidicaulis sp.]
MTYEQMQKAALVAVRVMGPALKSVSWFKRNWQEPVTEEEKKAA